jgi:hypothetical protein
MKLTITIDETTRAMSVTAPTKTVQFNGIKKVVDFLTTYNKVPLDTVAVWNKKGFVSNGYDFLRKYN